MNEPLPTENLSEAYARVLQQVWHNPEFTCAPRGQKVREALFCRFTTRLDQELVIKTKSELRDAKLASYFARELELYKSGTLDSAEFAKIGKIWGTIANPDGLINSNYGYLAFHAKGEVGSPHYQEGGPTTHWEWCLEAIRRDRDTRQAVIHFSRPRHFWPNNRDQVCALSAQFLVRDGNLHLAWTSRSNDLVFGTPYDAMFALWMAQKMQRDLLEKTGLLVGLGRLSYMAHSLHIYERDAALVLAMLGEPPPTSSSTT